MRLPLIPVLIVLVIGIVVDIFLYRRLRRSGAGRGWCILYASTAVLFSALLLLLACLPKRSADDEGLRGIMWLLYAYFSVYLPKYVAALFSLLAGLGERLSGTKTKLTRGLGVAGWSLGALLFGAMWWGALVNRFNTDIKRVEIEIPDLPAAFDGFTIAQISDFHVGTYGSDTAFVAKVVDEINELHPDVVVFTGDIVNRHSSELIPHTRPFSRLRGRMGVYSIMGNHDYGDYYSWPSEEAHAADVADLKRMQAGMGWKMLNNETAWIVRGTDSLALIGVENIGDPPFPVYGSLTKAYPALDDKHTKILLSHNPAHWDDSIAGNPAANVALTLSGHTHAMQIEVLGASPAAFRYPTWGGLYDDEHGHQLYVNIGAGEVAIPARIGATPEITLITLRPKH